MPSLNFNIFLSIIGDELKAGSHLQLAENIDCIVSIWKIVAIYIIYT